MKANSSGEKLNRVNILGVYVSPLTVLELHNQIETYILKNKKALILHVNIHCLNLAYRQPWLRDFLNKSEIVFCDGAGVMLGAQILRHSLPERITYADWMWQLGEFSQSKEFTLFFLGARPGVAEKAVKRMRERLPRLKIVGSHHGYFNKLSNHAESKAVIQKINSVKPHILIVGFGMPIQEQWLLKNWHEIEANIALTGGAVFDYMSGELARAPQWMTKNSLEWLGRLIIEPQRLWKRYILGNPIFLWRVLKQRFHLLPKSVK